MRLLCATDLSSRSDRALRRAARLAREKQAELVLLSVVDDDQPPALVASERREVATLLARQVADMPEMQGLAPRLRVEAGDAFDAIIRIAAEEAVDLVVMGEHRKRLLADIFTGTTVERVMRLGRRPVLMANAPSAIPYRSMLVATDMSPQATAALRMAVRLGLAPGGALAIFHAFRQPGREAMAVAGLGAETIAGHVSDTAARIRTEIATHLAGLGLDLPAPPAIVLEEGAPAGALRRAVDRLAPDLVVIGTRGLGAIGRLLLGSVAEEALRTLGCDVLAVPSTAS